VFLDIWLKNLNHQLGWYAFFFLLLFLGILIGFFFQKFNKLFYIISTFLFFLIGGRCSSRAQILFDGQGVLLIICFLIPNQSFFG